MSDPNNIFGNLMSDRAKTVAAVYGAGLSLSVAVLGPGMSNPDDPGSRKRKQIRDALEDDGHRPFFPEDLVGSDPPSESLLEKERTLLGRPDVDLVIVLHTSTSYGAIAELGNFVSVPEIKAKTAVLFPIEYYMPDESLVANTVRDYLIKMPYTDSHFEACQLVSECRKWASDRATGMWPVGTPYRF